MATQLSLLEPDARRGRGPQDRLFLAIFPEPDVAAAIVTRARELGLKHGLKGKWLEQERLHVSLHHIGDGHGVPREIVSIACAVASTVTAPPFVVAFNSAVSFRGRRGGQPLVLRGDDGVAGLIAFQATLSLAMAKVGLGRSTPRFTPHVTLMYGDPLATEQVIAPISWTVREVALVHSLLDRHTYNVLARFPLRRCS